MTTPLAPSETGDPTDTTVPAGSGSPVAPAPGPAHRVAAGAFDTRLLVAAIPDALRKLDPRHQLRNPVMLVVWVGSALTTGLSIADPSVFSWLVTAWLWLTVLFGNLAESVAEGRGKAQADTLRRARADTVARRLRGVRAEDLTAPGAVPAAETDRVPAAELRPGDLVEVAAGEVIPGDGDVVEGIATVDESAITGESAPVIREAGGDFSAVTGGTTVLSDRIVVRITSTPGESFVDRMIALVEGAQRQRTPNELALTILLSALTIVFLLAVVSLQPMAAYSGAEQSVVVLTALLVCLIPTTIGALLSAIGIAGMDRLVQHNVLAMSGRAVEAAGDVDTLLLDKTGTVTHGNRRATELIALGGTTDTELVDAARLASLADATPEGRSIVELCCGPEAAPAGAQFVEFTAQTRMSGVDLADGRRVRKGAASAVTAWVAEHGARVGDDVARTVDRVAADGATPLVVAVLEPGPGDGAGDLAGDLDGDGSGDGSGATAGTARVLGVVRLSDVVKDGMAQRFARLRAMGIRTVMVTGDNPLTAAAIARQAGVDDHLAEATPEAKMALIRKEQQGGRLVAMTGDGTNDAPALAQADVGVAMNSGTAAAKEAGNMVDLDSDPTKLIEIVEIGKQLLITRGALTTFSIANDLAKYFAILPAMFVLIHPQLDRLNVMRLDSPQSAILSAVIFNALVIVALVPLALRGVRYTPSSASALLRRNLLIYGVGGVVTPFVGILAIDQLVRLVPGIG